MSDGYKIGIDPGQSNLGLAVLDDANEPVVIMKINPKVYGSICQTVSTVEGLVFPYIDIKTTTAAIEKYVVYGRGTPSAASVDVTMMVGALQYMFHKNGIDAKLYRAIDWKQKVCKHLYKENEFRNPSDSFDKKFSFAAAECICGMKPGTDHEADAVGVALASSLV